MCNQKVKSHNAMLADINISQRPFQTLLLIHSDLEFLLEIRGQPGNWIRVCFYVQQFLKRKFLLCFIDCLADRSAGKSHEHS